MKATWTGAISWGMVTIPVKLYKASRDRGVSFNMVTRYTDDDGETHVTGVGMKRYNKETGADVEYGDVLKGYKLSKDSWLVIEPAELDALRPEQTKTLSIEAVVDITEIPVGIASTAYFVTPDKLGIKAYALFTAGLGPNRAAIGRFVMRQSEYLVALTVNADGVLVATRLHFADEINDPSTIPTLEDASKVTLSSTERDMAETLIDSLKVNFDHHAFVDEFRVAVDELIQNKAAGLPTQIVPETGGVELATDLMDALKVSIEKAKAERAAKEGEAA